MKKEEYALHVTDSVYTQKKKKKVIMRKGGKRIFKETISE